MRTAFAYATKTNSVHFLTPINNYSLVLCLRNGLKRLFYGSLSVSIIHSLNPVHVQIIAAVLRMSRDHGLITSNILEMTSIFRQSRDSKIRRKKC